MDNEDVKGMSEADLKRNLITCDFRGRDFKQLCLDELLHRERSAAQQATQQEGGH